MRAFLLWLGAKLMITLFLTLLALNVVAGGRILAGLFGKTVEPALLLDALDLVIAMVDAEINQTAAPSEPSALDRQARYTYELAAGVYGALQAAKVPAGLAKSALQTTVMRMQKIESEFTAAVAAGGTPIS